MTEERGHRRPRRRTLLIATASVVGCLAGVVGGYAATQPGNGDQVGSPDDPAASTRPDPGAPQVTSLRPLYEALNVALHEGDRTAFLAHVDGAATEPLTLWWDNMDALGWTTGAISPMSDGSVDVTGDVVSIEVLLGADMGFTQRHPPAEGSTEPGGIYTLGYPYSATVDLTGAEPVLTTWEPMYSLRPWDAVPLTVIRGEGVVVAGHADEERTLRRTAAAAEVASAWSRADYEGHDGVAPTEGFLVFATKDTFRFRSWSGVLAGDDWVDPAGIAFYGYLPESGTAGVDVSLATGYNPSGGLVGIGPGAGWDPEGLPAVLAHEFAHVLQLIDNPTRSVSPPRVTDEGWAFYQHRRFLHDGTFPLDGATADEVRFCVGDGQPAVPSDDDLLGEDAWCAYVLAGTIYAYAASVGIDPEELADVGLRRGVSPFGAAQRMGTPMSGDAWAAWVVSTFR